VSLKQCTPVPAKGFYLELVKSLSGRKKTMLLYQTRVNEEHDRINRLHTLKENKEALSNVVLDV
jgi:hypothetical protein